MENRKRDFSFLFSKKIPRENLLSCPGVPADSDLSTVTGPYFIIIGFGSVFPGGDYFLRSAIAMAPGTRLFTGFIDCK